jgi:hypothetical protein
MDLTAVEICAADFQILLVESTFCQCRFTLRTGVGRIGVATLWDTILSPNCSPGSFLTTQNMSVVNQLFQSPSQWLAGRNELEERYQHMELATFCELFA